MKPISIGKLFKMYMSTLDHCGEILLSFPDEKIGAYIFEEFDIEVTTFLHRNTLDKLEDAGLIDKILHNYSRDLRQKFMALQGTSLWNVKSVKTALEWRQIMKLSDRIRALIKDKWSDEELKYLYENE